eukprot:scaffold19225_cov107-Isochrysis_galbana.AAC.5
MHQVLLPRVAEDGQVLSLASSSSSFRHLLFPRRSLHRLSEKGVLSHALRSSFGPLRRSASRRTGHRPYLLLLPPPHLGARLLPRPESAIPRRLLFPLSPYRLSVCPSVSGGVAYMLRQEAGPGLWRGTGFCTLVPRD